MDHVDADSFLPEGCLATARINIVQAIDVDGSTVHSWYAIDVHGDALEKSRALGILEHVKLDLWSEGAE